MSNKYRESSPLTFTTAAYDEWRELERQYDLVFNCSIRNGVQRGVLVLEVYAHHISSVPGSRPTISYSGSWPNSTATSFEAFWYQTWHKVARMVESWAQDRNSA